MKKVLLLTLVLVLSLFLNVYAQTGVTTLAFSNFSGFRKASPTFLETVNFNEESLGGVFSNKLGDGVINIATCWTDVPRHIDKVSRERSILEGYTIGVGEGIFSGVIRGVAGTYDTSTSILPPYNSQPLMKAEYSVKDPDREGFKINLLNW